MRDGSILTPFLAMSIHPEITLPPRRGGEGRGTRRGERLSYSAVASRCSPHTWRRTADLTERDVAFHGLDEERHQVFCALRRALDPLQRSVDFRLVAVGAQGTSALAVARRSRGRGAGRAAPAVVVEEVVDADDDLALLLDGPLHAVGTLVDLALLEAGLDAGQCPAHVVDAVDVGLRLLLDPVRELLDVRRAGERVDGVGDTRLESDDLLRAQRQVDGVLLGSASASSKEFVCSDCVPPSTAASPWSAVRTRLFTGCCAVSVAPPVWVWKRSIIERGSLAPKRSLITRAQSRRAARNFATSSRKWLWQAKKNDSRGAKSSILSPRRAPPARTRSRRRW